MKDVRKESIRDALAGIERRVLDEVWIGRSRWAGYAALTVLLLAATGAGASTWSVRCLDPGPTGCR